MKWGDILALVVKKGNCGVGGWSSVGGRSNCFIGVWWFAYQIRKKTRRTFKGVETARNMALVVLVN